MNRTKIFHIVGARPQFIKFAAVYKAIINDDTFDKIKHIIIHTGQHYDFLMSDIFFREFKIPFPDYNLGVGSDNHGKQTAKMIEGIEELILQHRPSLAVVYGDTNTTLAGALASVKHHVPVAHVEAGLRSFNKKMPEEVNRVLTDHCSTILFCPSENAVENLKREGFNKIISDGKLISIKDVDKTELKADESNPIVLNVGDVMYDILLRSLDIASKSNILEQLNLREKGYNVLTIHRAENTDNVENLQKLLAFVSEVSNGKNTIFPVHPRTRKLLSFVNSKLGAIKLIEPLSYFDMLWLVKNANLVFTDSGGLQKEAYWLSVPCITLRDETEWIETVMSGWNILYKDYKVEHAPSHAKKNIYGDGEASYRIVKIIANFLL
jgi:UDP-N-acetylglucosamine 2-epimerase